MRPQGETIHADGDSHAAPGANRGVARTVYALMLGNFITGSAVSYTHLTLPTKA